MTNKSVDVFAHQTKRHRKRYAKGPTRGGDLRLKSEFYRESTRIVTIRIHKVSYTEREEATVAISSRLCSINMQSERAPPAVRRSTFELNQFSLSTTFARAAETREQVNVRRLNPVLVASDQHFKPLRQPNNL
jgi:hypothetical protein